MSDTNEQYAYFTIYGDFDPAEITRHVGVEPTDAWRKGDRHPRRGTEARFSRWSLRSRLGKEAELELHIADVLSQLARNEVAFREVSAKHSGTMQLVGYFHTGYPGLYFEPETLASLAKYSLGMDLDFYALWSDARDDA